MNIIEMFVKNLTILDYAYLDSARGLLGDTLIVNARFIGKVDEEGVIYDFSHAKKHVKKIIDQVLDHRVAVPEYLVKTDKDSEITELKFEYGQEKSLEYTAPSQAFALINAKVIRRSDLIYFLEKKINEDCPENIIEIKIELEDEIFENTDKPLFRYTHGLKQHYGNCQRLFHGHINTVDVFIDGKQDISLENVLASTFQDVHFAIKENFVNKDKFMPGERNEEEVELEYEGNQGRFYGKFPPGTIYCLPEKETTIEWLTKHFADIVKEMLPDSRVEVRGYEGIGKGAIVCK